MPEVWPAVRRAALFSLLALAGVMTVSVGVSSALRDFEPARALVWAPWDARAKANLAAAELEKLTVGSPGIGDAARLAGAAVARDLTYEPGIRTLGLARAMAGHAEATRSLFAASANTLRRDLPAQLWLIEDRVQANDVAGALGHYDMALTTTRLAAPILLPILVQASAQPGMVEPIAGLLTEQRPWARDLLALMIANPPSPEALVEIIQALDEAGKPLSRDAMSSIVSTMVNRGRMDLAWTAYRLARHLPALDARQVRDGGFEQADDYPPGDWMQNQTPDRHVHRDVGAKGGNALFFAVTRSTGAVIASQMMQLPPGQYRLSGAAGGIPDADRPYWELACAGETSTSLGQVSLSPARGHGRFIGILIVKPGACGHQMLKLVSPPSAYDTDDQAWVDDLSIARIS